MKKKSKITDEKISSTSDGDEEEKEKETGPDSDTFDPAVFEESIMDDYNDYNDVDNF